MTHEVPGWAPPQRPEPTQPGARALGPAGAAALGIVAAPIGRRVLAALVNGVLGSTALLPVVAALVLGDRSGESIVFGLVIAVVLLVLIGAVQLVLAAKGGSLGSRALGLRIIDAASLRALGYGRTLLRWLVFGAAGIVPGIGTALMACSVFMDAERRGRGWHDLAARAWLVDATGGTNPLDASALAARRERAMRRFQPESAPRRTDQHANAHDEQRWAPPVASVPGPLADEAYRPGELRAAADAPLSAGFLGVPAPAADPESASGTAVDASTIVRAPAREEAFDDLERTRVSARPVAASLRLDTGAAFEIVGLALFGRNPEPGAGEVASHLVPVQDELRTVSKTHLAVRPTPHGVAVIDRGSTNGSRILRGAERIELDGREQLAVAGDIVEFGEHRLEVVAHGR